MPDGFYWVKYIFDSWTVAENVSGFWRIVGDIESYSESELTIGPYLGTEPK